MKYTIQTNKHIKLLGLFIIIGSVIMTLVSCDVLMKGIGESAKGDNPTRSENNTLKQDNDTMQSFFNAADLDDEIITDSTKSLMLFVHDTRLNREKLIAQTGGYIEKEFSINGKTFLKMSNVSVQVKQIKQVEGVISVEYDVMRHTFATPNDTKYNSQYAPQITGLEAVWESECATGVKCTGAGVKVAVIDTGVDTLHEDFGGSTAFQTGKNFSTTPVSNYGTTENNDAHGHGTHVAGIIGARRNNNKGIVGVAPDATIIPYRASGAGASSGFSGSNIAAAIKAATDAGADVINMSLGGLSSSFIEFEAVNYAIKNKVVVVVATGNAHGEYMAFPASYPGVIAVGSSTGTDEVSYFSTRNSLISVVGPGSEILSLKAGSGHADYVMYSGTSMATPFVAGVAALLKQKFPDATPAQIKQILENTAKDIDKTGFDISAGHGRVDPVQALATTTLPTTSWTETEFTISLGGKVLPNYMITLLNGNKPYYSMYTDSNGKANAYIPQGNYSFVSGYLGVAFNGNIVIGTSKESKTKSFVAVDFPHHYRVSTVYNTNDVDTFIVVYKYPTNGAYALLGYNDDKVSGDIHSELAFLSTPNTRYLIVVFASSNAASDAQKTGTFQVIIENNIFAATPTTSTSLTTQATSNITPLTLQNNTLVQGELTTNNPSAYYTFTTP